jgi:uncharacterized membrane protein YqhA
MLNKLLKYDLKNVYKVLVIFYILTIVFALITRLISSVNTTTISNIIFQISSSITISMMASLIINNLMRMWARFVSNLYKDESYLTHTLPVSRAKIYISKFLTSVITMFTSVIIIAIALFIAYYSKENIEIVKNVMLPIATMYDSTVLKIILTFVFIVFLEMLATLQAGFTGIILGYRHNNNKTGFSVIFGFVAYMLGQMLVLVSVFLLGILNSDIMMLFETNIMPNVETIKIILYLAIGVYSVLTAIYYVINKKLLSKGVNVD